MKFKHFIDSNDAYNTIFELNGIITIFSLIVVLPLFAEDIIEISESLFNIQKGATLSIFLAFLFIFTFVFPKILQYTIDRIFYFLVDVKGFKL